MLLNLTISYHLFAFEFNGVASFVFLRLLLRVLLVSEMRITFHNVKSASLTVQESTTLVKHNVSLLVSADNLVI